ncbi:hypothetical protein [Pseudomonas aeruginosa]|uniref:hypothetical protein n=1 Tax=Pseudomonas aeruginosa TaxID=287 RepID=UPI0032B3C8A9
MTYKKCNEVLEGVFKDSLNAAPESHVVAPWGVSLNGVGRFAAVAAIGAGMVGVAKNQSGKYKLYYGAKRAGNWLFEIWPLWKSAPMFGLYAAVWYFLLQTGVPAIQVPGMLVMAVLGVVLFGGRAISCRKHYPAAAIVGATGYATGLVPSLMGLAMAAGSGLAAYAFIDGMKMGGTIEGLRYAGVSGSVMEVVKYFLFATPMALVAAYVVQGALSLFSLEALVKTVMHRSDFTRNLRGAAEVSGLRSIFENKLGKRGGGNVFATLVFGVILLGMALWPLGYVLRYSVVL